MTTKPCFRTLRAPWLGVLLAFSLGNSSALSKDPIYAKGITEPILDVTLSAPVPGILTVQHYQEGDFVKEGAVILELDKRMEELDAARRKLVMENRKTDWQATLRLFNNSQSVSKEELEKREVEYQVAQVEYEIAVEQVRRRHVSAPLSGVITEIFLDVGEACQPYQPLARVVDTRRCYFICNIEARNAPALKMGQVLPLEIDTGDTPARLEGQICFLSPVADPASGLYKVKVIFSNPDGKLRPGLAGSMVIR